MKIKNQILNSKGQGLIEYLIIVALVAVATIGIVRVVGQNVSVQYANISRALGGQSYQLQAEKPEEKLYKKKDLSDFLQNSGAGTGQSNSTHGPNSN